MRVADGSEVGAALSWAADVVGPIGEVRELRGGWTSTMLALEADGRDPVVLRVMTREPWRSHGPELTARESRTQRLLADTDLPVPVSLAIDVDGTACGHPAHLMTLLPGRVEPARVDPLSLSTLADTLATIHEVPPPSDLRNYQSWAYEAKYAVPAWATEPALWLAAFDLLRRDPPECPPCFLHRDFQHRNLLWSGDGLTGVVDWVETSVGPAWLDVAHYCTDLAIRHGEEVADAFARTYADLTGREPQPHIEVMDAVGWLPAPARHEFVTNPGERLALEQRLRSSMARAGF